MDPFQIGLLVQLLGVLLLAVLVAILIRSHRRALARLAESEDRFRLVFEHSGVGMALFSPAGAILTVNPALLRFLGYDIDQLRNHSLSEFIFRARASQEDSSSGNALEDPPDLYEREKCYKHKDGHPVWARVLRVPARDGEGRVRHFVGVLVDVTERRRLEQQLRQVQKMEAVGRLAGGVAHDFNNLLTVITGYGEVLLGGLSAADPSQGLVREILKAAERAADLTRQLLAFSRKQMRTVAVLDLSSVVGDMENMLRRLIREDIELHMQLAPNLRAVKADKTQIEQIILNLTVNARDAMGAGGLLTITTDNVELDRSFALKHPEARPGPYSMIEVNDTGCGMDDNTKAQIFEPFFTTKELGHGTGLGLATVYGIVKQSGGYIYVDSAPGLGARFAVYLPSVVEALPGPDRLPSLPAAGQSEEVVLVVEDQIEVRGLVRQVLQRAGYTVLEAGDGNEALAVSARHPGSIQLLVTDVVMPLMGGRELAEHLVPQRPGIKVLFLSGYADDPVFREGVLKGSSAFLQKPFAPETLIQAIRALLDP